MELQSAGDEDGNASGSPKRRGLGYERPWRQAMSKHIQGLSKPNGLQSPANGAGPYSGSRSISKEAQPLARDSSAQRLQSNRLPQLNEYGGGHF